MDKLSIERSMNGPPDPVRMILFRSSLLCPWIDCCIALCSLSIGNIFIPIFFDSLINKDPAITNVSLLAKATSLPAVMAENVGSKPEDPVIAAIAIFTSERVAIFI